MCFLNLLRHSFFYLPFFPLSSIYVSMKNIKAATVADLSINYFIRQSAFTGYKLGKDYGCFLSPD